MNPHLKDSSWPHYKGKNVELMLCGTTTIKPPFRHIDGLRLVSYVDNYINSGKNVLHMRVGSNRKITSWLPLDKYNNKLNSYWMKKCKFDIINILQNYDKGKSNLVLYASLFKKWKRFRIEEEDTYYKIRYSYDFFSGKIIIPKKSYVIMTTSSLVWPLKSKNEFIELPMVNLERITLKS